MDEPFYHPQLEIMMRKAHFCSSVPTSRFLSKIAVLILLIQKMVAESS